MNETLAGFALSVYSATLPLSQGTFAVCVLVLLPMAVFHPRAFLPVQDCSSLRGYLA